MIKLEVEAYCHDCQAFEPDVEDSVVVWSRDDNAYRSDTIVRCKAHKLCKRLVGYLKKQIEKEGNADG